MLFQVRLLLGYFLIRDYPELDVRVIFEAPERENTLPMDGYDEIEWVKDLGSVLA